MAFLTQVLSGVQKAWYRVEQSVLVVLSLIVAAVIFAVLGYGLYAVGRDLYTTLLPPAFPRDGVVVALIQAVSGVVLFALPVLCFVVLSDWVLPTSREYVNELDEEGAGFEVTSEDDETRPTVH